MIFVSLIGAQQCKKAESAYESTKVFSVLGEED